jgi:hypothetical protein
MEGGAKTGGPSKMNEIRDSGLVGGDTTSGRYKTVCPGLP